MWILDLLSLLVLGVIAWEDLRYRAIRWWLLPALFLSMALPALLHARPWYMDAGYNLIFLLVQFTAAVGLLLLRQRRFTNPVDNWVGTGDLLFLLVVALALPRWNFLLFYLSGLALCIPAQLLLRKLSPGAARSVPLAGFLAIYLGCWVALERSGLAPFGPQHAPLTAFLPHG